MATPPEADTTSRADAIGGASNPEAVTPIQGSLEDYEALVAHLESLDDDELRALAQRKGIDATEDHARADLIAKLSDQPDANEH